MDTVVENPVMRFERSARPEGSRDAGGRKVELGQKLKDLQERARQLGYRLVIQRRGMEASGRERNGAEWTEAEPVSGSEPFRNGQAPTPVLLPTESAGPEARAREALFRALAVLHEKLWAGGWILEVREITEGCRSERTDRGPESGTIVGNERCREREPQAGGLKRGAESPDGWSEGEKRRQVKPQEDGPPCKKFHGAPAQSRAEQSFHPGRAAKDGTPPETNAEAYRGSIEALRHPDHGPGDVPGEMTSLRQHGQEMTEYDPQDKARIDAELDGRDPVSISLRPNLTSPGEGLENLGNTCYLSTVIQSIMYALQNLLLDEHHFRICRVPVAQFCLVCSLERLLEACLSGPGSTAHEWRNVVDNQWRFVPDFEPGCQQDAHEALLKILKAVEETLGSAGRENESVERSVISAIFGGTSQTQLTCLTCGKRSLKEPVPFMDLSLGITGLSLESALEAHTAQETLGGEDKVFCEGVYCKKNRATRIQILIGEPPRILIAHVKRFKENGAKDETHVGFSETLQAAHYLTPASRASRPRYKLEGVIVHEGDSPDAGHYTAHLFVGGGWYHFDDAIVTRVEWTEVAAAQGYIFFYRRSDPDSSLLVKPAHGRARDARGGRARTAPQDGARAHSLARTQTARACMESEASTARADAFEAQAPAEKERGGAVSTTVSTEHLLGDETPGKSAPVAKVGILDATTEDGSQKGDEIPSFSKDSRTAPTAIEAGPELCKHPEDVEGCHVAGPEPANECSADANEASGQILGAHGRTEDMDVETRQGGVGLKAEISGEVQREKVGRNEEREKNVLLTGEDTFEACPGDGSSGPRERGPVGAKPPPFETPFETASIEEPPGDCQASPLQTDRCTKTSGQAWRCPLRRAFGYSKCHKHLEMERRKHARRRARNEEAQRERARAEGSYVVRAQEAENGRGARDAEVPSNGRAADQNLEPEPEPERTQSAGSAQKGDFPAARSQNDSASKPSLKSRTGAESAGFGSQLGDPTYPLRNRKRKLVQMEKKRQDAVGGRAEDPIVIASDDDTPVTKRPGSSTALSRIDDVKERSYSTGLWLPPPGESTERPAEDFVLPEISGEEQPGRVEGARAQESGPSYDWSNKRISDADVVREAGGGISSCDKKGGVRLVKEDRRAGPVKETQISEALYRRASREPTKVAGRRE